MMMWFCVLLEIIMLIVVGLVVFYCVFYFLMERKYSDFILRSWKEMKFEYEKIFDDGKIDVFIFVLLIREVKF